MGSYLPEASLEEPKGREEFAQSFCDALSESRASGASSTATVETAAAPSPYEAEERAEISSRLARGGRCAGEAEAWGPPPPLLLLSPRRLQRRAGSSAAAAPLCLRPCRAQGEPAHRRARCPIRPAHEYTGTRVVSATRLSAAAWRCRRRT